MENFFQEFLRNFISKFLFIRLLDIKIMIFIKRHINLLIVVIQIFYRIQAYSIDSKISIIEVSEFFCSRNTWFWFFRFFAPWLRLFLRFWFFNVKFRRWKRGPLYRLLGKLRNLRHLWTAWQGSWRWTYYKEFGTFKERKIEKERITPTLSDGTRDC